MNEVVLKVVCTMGGQYITISWVVIMMSESIILSGEWVGFSITSVPIEQWHVPVGI